MKNPLRPCIWFAGSGIRGIATGLIQMGASRPVSLRRAVIVEKMREREVARRFGLARETMRKMLRYSAPPGYQRQQPARQPTRITREYEDWLYFHYGRPPYWLHDEARHRQSLALSGV